MRKLFLAAVALLMLTSISPAQMGRCANRGYSQPSGGPFSRLIELERRKNAWLRERFLGR